MLKSSRLHAGTSACRRSCPRASPYGVAPSQAHAVRPGRLNFTVGRRVSRQGRYTSEMCSTCDLGPAPRGRRRGERGWVVRCKFKSVWLGRAKDCAWPLELPKAKGRSTAFTLLATLAISQPRSRSTPASDTQSHSDSQLLDSARRYLARPDCVPALRPHPSAQPLTPQLTSSRPPSSPMGACVSCCGGKHLHRPDSSQLHFGHGRACWREPRWGSHKLSAANPTYLADAGSKSGGNYEPLLLENEREAVADLLQYLESQSRSSSAQTACPGRVRLGGATTDQLTALLVALTRPVRDQLLRGRTLDSALYAVLLREC